MDELLGESMKRPNNLKVARTWKKLSVQDAAEQTGVTRKTFWRWETGRSSIPDVKVELLAEILDVKPAFIKGWEPTPEQWDALGLKGDS